VLRFIKSRHAVLAAAVLILSQDNFQFPFDALYACRHHFCFNQLTQLFFELFGREPDLELSANTLRSSARSVLTSCSTVLEVCKNSSS